MRQNMGPLPPYAFTSFTPYPPQGRLQGPGDSPQSESGLRRGGGGCEPGYGRLAEIGASMFIFCYRGRSNVTNVHNV